MHFVLSPPRIGQLFRNAKQLKVGGQFLGGSAEGDFAAILAKFADQMLIFGILADYNAQYSYY